MRFFLVAETFGARGNLERDKKRVLWDPSRGTFFTTVTTGRILGISALQG